MGQADQGEASSAGGEEFTRGRTKKKEVYRIHCKGAVAGQQSRVVCQEAVVGGSSEGGRWGGGRGGGMGTYAIFPFWYLCSGVSSSLVT